MEAAPEKSATGGCPETEKESKPPQQTEDLSHRDLELKDGLRPSQMTVSKIPKNLYPSCLRGLEMANSEIVNFAAPMRGLDVREPDIISPFLHTPNEHRYCPPPGPEAKMFATNNLDEDETVYETNNHVWPKTYRWRLVSRHWISGWPYTAAVVIHLQDLPRQLQDGAGIDWDDLHQHFEFTRSWCTDQESWKSTTEWKSFRLGAPKWELRVHLQHYSLKQVHHPDCRGLVDLKKMNFLSIYERIGSEHHKEVVRFDPNMMYGNDLLGQEIQAWDKENAPEELEAFLQSLYPTPKAASKTDTDPVD